MTVRQSIILWLRNCWRIIKFSSRRYLRDQLSQQSIVLTYYTLFSIVPMLALIFGISKGFGFAFSLRRMLIHRFPAHQEMLIYICDLAEWALKEASGGVIAGVGVIALVWTVVWLIHNIEKSFNVIWGLPPRRNVIRKFSNYFSLVMMTPIMMVAISTLGVMVRTKVIEHTEKFPDNHFEGFLWESAAEVLPVCITVLLFLFIYWFVPNTKVRWTSAVVAALLVGISFQILQASFLWLQSSVFSYNRLYGGFAILPLFLIWSNWSWQLILFGAEISFVHQHLKSGIFNEGRRKISIRLRRVHQLAVLRCVYVAFENAAGAVSVDKVALELRVPESVLRSEIDELVDCGMICRSVQEDGEVVLLPAMPPDRLTVVDFLRGVNGSVDDESPELACIEKLFCELEQLVEKSDANVKIHEV